MPDNSRQAFTDWFAQAVGAPPFPYQVELATGDRLPEVLNAPTGSGKTALALAWLWRLSQAPPEIRMNTGRRLVWCLPTRVLVEQTHASIRNWLEKLGLLAGAPGDTGRVWPVLLMGGEPGKSGWEAPWCLYPEQPMVLVGTQEMLLSRALNRGYGASRYRWPQEFALLHNDVVWVLDEVQLMGSGVLTTAQLDGLRAQMGTYGPAHTIWVSATQERAWLSTPDHPAPSRLLGLTPDDHQNLDLSARLCAPKPLREAGVPAGDPEGLAAAIWAQHQQGTTSLVVVNTVERARGVYRAIKRLGERGTALSEGGSPLLHLIHSRFRPFERRVWMDWLNAPPHAAGRIIVATQVIEAGVDLDARVLWTEVAPWTSLVQRFGRCNRRGQIADAGVFWVPVPEHLPYTAGEMDAATILLSKLTGRSVNPETLAAVTPPARAPAGQMLRRRDLLGLFDTGPDLSGNDLDVSALIREMDDRDVYLYWRDWNGDVPGRDLRSPRGIELCPAPVNKDLQGLLQRSAAWVYDHLADRWRRVSGRDVRPGQVLLLHTGAGGYDPDLGWTARSDAPVVPVPLIDTNVKSPDSEAVAGDESLGADPDSGASQWASVAQHTDAVIRALSAELDHLPWVKSAEQAALHTAARWHDAGKGHPVFRATMQAAATASGVEVPPDVVLAKAPGRMGRHTRRHFRHELVSALLFLDRQARTTDTATSLAAYLIAAHHGKVRLAIRSFPDEHRPPDSQTRFALGVWEGEVLGVPVDLGDGIIAPADRTADLGIMELGFRTAHGPSWVQRMLTLRDQEFGPFRLAYLECLLRAADARASMISRPAEPEPAQGGPKHE